MPGKNKKGGSGYRKMARKNIRSDYKKPATRLANPSEGEIYSKVTKCYGNGMVDVVDSEGITRLCIIRKKFKGRNKKDNNVSVDSIVLVGIRTWEVLSGNKKPKVDLLYTYSPSQMEEIKKDKNFNIEVIDEKNEEQSSTIEFSNTAIVEQFNMKISKNDDVPQKSEKQTENKKTDVGEINWDDI